VPDEPVLPKKDAYHHSTVSSKPALEEVHTDAPGVPSGGPQDNDSKRMTLIKRNQVVRRFCAVRALTATLGVMALFASSGWAHSTGSPVCTIDAATFDANMLPPVISSPNGWSLTAPTGYVAGQALQIGVRNTNTTKQFRGLLLWVTNAQGALVGTFIAPSGYQLCQGNGGSVTHTSNSTKSQQNFTFTPPLNAAGDLTVRAAVVEECGLPPVACRPYHALLNPITLTTCATTEICNGLDDTCNGQVDEGLPLATCGVGACQRTGTTCSTSTCTAGLPTTETCNGVDDDCNGQVDDGLALAKCGVGACARVGTTCAPSSCTPGQPSSETCNGVDDNCDGHVDEGLAVATCGVGACARTGSTCALDSCTPGAPSAEVCNGLDDNCNGQVDDGLALATCGVGACGRTGSSCQATSCTSGQPSTEVCNGLDDDCDGQVDNAVGCVDAGSADAGAPDAGNSGVLDAGSGGGGTGSCGCSVGDSALALVALVLLRRRPSRAAR
jgi:Reeler domain/Putative metal-binding motif